VKDKTVEIKQNGKNGVQVRYEAQKGLYENQTITISTAKTSLQQGDQMNCKDRKEEREVDFPFGSIFSLVCSFSHLKRIRFYLNTHCIM
jgi:hypothetical protein